MIIAAATQEPRRYLSPFARRARAFVDLWVRRKASAGERREVATRGAQTDRCDFGVSFVSTVAGRYTRWGGPHLSDQGEPLIVLTRGFF